MKHQVLFVLNSLCVGGAEKHVVSLLNRLDDDRLSVSLVTLKAEQSLLGQLDQSRCSHALECLGVGRGVEWAAVRRLGALIEERGAEVVVCTDMYALLYAWLALRLVSGQGRGGGRPRVRLVEVFHTTLPPSRKDAWSMRLLYRPLVRGIDLLVFVCQAQAAHWWQRGLRARQDLVIHNGIDTARFVDRWSAADKADLRRQHGLTDDDYVIGLCAAMRPEKAHGDLLAAVAALNRPHPGGVAGMADVADVVAAGAPAPRAHCLFIGDGPERARIEREAAALGLDAHVHITGFVQDVRPLVALCDVMAITSHAVETFSIAALEAMALGKPMVMTDIGGAREQVTPGENGLLYTAGDIDALTRALRLLADPPRRAAMGARAAAHVRERFDVDVMVRRFEGALTGLLA